MSIFDDLAAEQERLEKILSGLDEGQWESASGAQGWTITDVVLHLAQSEEAAAATATHGNLRGALDAVAGETTDERADAAVRAQRPVPPSGGAEVFARWQRARQAQRVRQRAVRQPGNVLEPGGVGEVGAERPGDVQPVRPVLG